MEYASRAVGNAGLATGIIGTALGVDYRKRFMTVLECISWFI